MADYKISAVKVRLQFSKWFSKCNTKESIEKLCSVIMEEAEEAKEDRLFDLLEEAKERENEEL